MELSVQDIIQLVTVGIPGSPTSRQNAAANVGPWEIGKTYFIRTVTMNLTGVLIGVYEHELELEDAAWIADSGRFADALKTGKFSEVEPFPGRVVVGRGALVDATIVDFAAPRDQK